MPRFQITDPVSGKTVTVDGPKPPSQQDAEQIFQAAGVRAAQGAAVGGGQPTDEGPNKWADILPTALGTVGQIGGGILGTVGGGAATIETGPGAVLGAIGGEKLGQTAGGALGQGGGEWLKEMLQGKKADPGAIASETAQGGIYGALPGSQLIKGAAPLAQRVLATGAKNFGGGAIIGGATQAVRNVQQGEDVTKDVGNQAITTGAINTLLPMGMRVVPESVKHLGGVFLDKIPASVRKQLDSLAAQMQQLEDEKLGNTVGHANSDRARKELGVYHTHSPQQARDVIEKEMQDVGGQLNETLGHETVGTNLANLKAELLKARDQAFSGSNKNDEKLGDFTERMNNFIKSQIQRIMEENLEKNGGKNAAEAATNAAAGQELNTAQSAASATMKGAAGDASGRTIQFGKKGNPITSMINGTKMGPMKGESPEDFIKRLEEQAVTPNKSVEFAGAPTSPLKTGVELNKANDFKATAQTGGFNRDQAVDFANDQSPVSLLTANEIKQQLGKLAFSKHGETVDPIFAQAYHNLQKHIEDSSGNPEKIRGLNDDYNQLRNMSQHAEREIANPKMTNADFNAKKLILENKTPRNQSLDTLAALAPILGASFAGPIGAGVGGTFAMYRLLSSLMANQGFQKGAVKAADAVKGSSALKIGSKLSKDKFANPFQRAIQQQAIQNQGTLRVDSLGND